MPDSVKRVDIIAVGNTRVIVPAGESWDLWFAADGVSSDFMESRDQPADQERAAELHAAADRRRSYRIEHAAGRQAQAAALQITTNSWQ